LGEVHTNGVAGTPWSAVVESYFRMLAWERAGAPNNLEIGRAEQGKTTASAEPCEVLCQDHGDCRIVAHARLSHLFDSPTHS